MAVTPRATVAPGVAVAAEAVRLPITGARLLKVSGAVGRWRLRCTCVVCPGRIAASASPEYRWCTASTVASQGPATSQASRWKRRAGLSNASNAHFAPNLERLMLQSPPGPIAAGQTSQFGAEVADGNLEPGYPLDIAWYDDGTTPAARGTFLARSPEAPYQLTARGLVSIHWRAPMPVAPGMRLRLRVTNRFGLFTEHSFVLAP